MLSLIEHVLTFIIPVGALAVGFYLLFRRIGHIENTFMDEVLAFRDDIALAIEHLPDAFSEGIESTLSKPAVSKAMGILGKRSGEVRANDAAFNKVADFVVNSDPIVKTIVDQVGIDPTTALGLLSDPRIKNILGLLGSGQGPQKSSSSEYGTRNW